MKTIIRLLAVAFALTTVFSLTYVSTASAQTADETQATISQLEDRVDTLEARATNQEARADSLEARADETNNQRRADRLDRRAAELDANAEATRARIARIEARIGQLQALLGNAPAPAPEPAPEPAPQPAPDRILQVADLDLSAAAQDELLTRRKPFGNTTRSIDRLVTSVSNNAVGLFSLAEDGRIINQNGQLVTVSELADSVSFSINQRLGFPSQDIRDEFRPLADNAAANLFATLNG